MSKSVDWGTYHGPDMRIGGARVCMWFALCDNLATGTMQHPVLGDVPICDRCRAKVQAIA